MMSTEFVRLYIFLMHDEKRDVCCWQDCRNQREEAVPDLTTKLSRMIKRMMKRPLGKPSGY
jgi:hypothetical protein